MSHALENHPEDCRWPDDAWSPNDQVLVALEGLRFQRNPHVVRLAVGWSLARTDVPPFIPAKRLGACRLLAPTACGRPACRGRLKVLPVFSDAEALEAWLPRSGGHQHPCFGPPADGVVAIRGEEISRARAQAGAVLVVLNPAGPGAYQLDPEDGSLDVPLQGDPWSGEPPEDDDREKDTGWENDDDPPPDDAGAGRPAGYSRDPDGQDPGRHRVAVPSYARGLLQPEGRADLRRQLDRMMSLADAQLASGRPERAVALLAKADRLAEVLGDYARRSRMLVSAAGILGTLGRRDTARELSRMAVLAAGLAAHGPLEQEAQRVYQDLHDEPVGRAVG